MHARRLPRIRKGSGLLLLQNIDRTSFAFGYSDGDFIRLRDDQGKIWRGTVEVIDRTTVRFRFRDGDGKSVSGITDNEGIILRDSRGKSWRGYLT